MSVKEKRRWQARPQCHTITLFYLQAPPSHLPSPARTLLQPPPPSLRLGEPAGTSCSLWGWGTTAPARSPSVSLSSATAGDGPRAFPGTRSLLVGGVLSEYHCHTKPCWAYTKAGHERQRSALTSSKILTVQPVAPSQTRGSFSSLEEQVCIYLISISIGRYPGLDPPILSVSLL